MESIDKGLKVCTKMGADKLFKNISNASTLSAQIVCQSSKVWNFDEKRLHWDL